MYRINNIENIINFYFTEILFKIYDENLPLIILVPFPALLLFIFPFKSRSSGDPLFNLRLSPNIYSEMQGLSESKQIPEDSRGTVALAVHIAPVQQLELVGLK